MATIKRSREVEIIELIDNGKSKVSYKIYRKNIEFIENPRNFKCKINLDPEEDKKINVPDLEMFTMQDLALKQIIDDDCERDMLWKFDIEVYN